MRINVYQKDPKNNTQLDCFCKANHARQCQRPKCLWKKAKKLVGEFSEVEKKIRKKNKINTTRPPPITKLKIEVDKIRLNLPN